MNQEILARIDALAAKLGVAASQVWATVVFQQRIDGAMFMVASLIVFVLSCFIWRVAKGQEHEGDRRGWQAVSVLAVLVAIVMLGSGVSLFINPEYAAFKEIAAILKY
jgi:hypothetical protein